MLLDNGDEIGIDNPLVGGYEEEPMDSRRCDNRAISRIAKDGERGNFLRNLAGYRQNSKDGI